MRDDQQTCNGCEHPDCPECTEPTREAGPMRDGYPEPPEGTRECPRCGVWTSNADHRCVEYTGPACQICGAGTVAGFYGAPGIGRFETCANGHELGDPPNYFEPDVEPRILEPWETV
jgi:hypothetical protein